MRHKIITHIYFTKCVVSIKILDIYEILRFRSRDRYHQLAEKWYLQELTGNIYI